MRWQPIRKTAAERAVANLADYQRAYQDFSWRGGHRSHLR
jgi:hypothetical protein